MSVESPAYRVLARKYRPQTLTELVGQELLVKTLTQAMAQNRLPHAFVLHGIRGVGKTTTARIIAKAINCLEKDPQNKNEDERANPNPCGKCSSCLAILEDRHLDVIEMDAASRTGVDDIREVIDSVKYKAVNGRYKIYIIDEVHMLSKSAFNALLKTLEEPPPHVKFIFATTELKKIPDTVLSRCMRFDLARITPPVLFAYFKEICAKESVSIDDEGLALIVRAADGSARDGLSLLDQAISLSQGHVTTDIVRDMLGLVDRGRTFQLLTLLMGGKIPEALAEIQDIYYRGGEPTVVVHDLLDLVYWITCLKTSPALKGDMTWPESDRKQGVELAQRLSVPTLMRAWQVLSKGYEEVLRSPLANQAAEMVLIRLAYLSEMPSAEDLYQFTQLAGSQIPGNPSLRSPVNSPVSMSTAAPMPIINAPAPAVSSPLEKTAEPTQIPTQNHHQSDPVDFQELLKIVAQSREPMLYSSLMQDIHLVSFVPRRIELRVNNRAPKTFSKDLETFLFRHTGNAWQVTLSKQGGQETIVEQKKQAHQLGQEQALEHPVVKEIMTHFPEVTAKVINA